MRLAIFTCIILTGVTAFPGKRLFGKIKDDAVKRYREGKIQRKEKLALKDAPNDRAGAQSSSCNSEHPPGASALLEEATKLFVSEFGTSPTLAAHAPGRVNLIGEHTDYTGGFVLPLALEKRTVVVGTGAVVDISAPDTCSIMSVGIEGGALTFDANPTTLAPGEPFWANYVKGVVAQYSAALPPGKKYAFKAVFASDVPLGAGLSSSAALEVSAATFLESLPGAPSPPPSKEEKAFRCQKAEHEYCGMPCGIMDQFISALGEEGSLLQIDCRTNVGTAVTMGAGDAVILVTNSNVKHALTGSEYPTRVAQCKAATEAIAKFTASEVTQLRDASLQMLDEAAANSAAEATKAAAKAAAEGIEGGAGSEEEETNNVLATSGDVYKRARHVISENARVLSATAALEAGDFEAVGEAMYKSHASLKDDFEVSCPELDTLVDLAGRYEGVYGSRMTGGGFGGCIVTLVKASAAEGLVTYLAEGYAEATGLKADSFVTRPGAGSGQLHLL